jgi:sugar O-acyltransferase (sialic acid O-acetyltransferase NeuD family)
MKKSEKAHRLLIFGASGHAREIGCLARDVFAVRGRGEVVAFVERDSGPQVGHNMHGVPVLTLDGAKGQFPAADFVVAIGDPHLRQNVAERAMAGGFVPASLVHPSVMMSEFVRLRPGSIICSGSILTCDIDIGAHVHLNRGCSIGHDVEIGDFATLSPGVRISGNVRIGPRAFIGVGACVVDGTPQKPLIIHEGAVVGAQACVLDDVARFQTVIGVPARPKSLPLNDVSP